jgi:hypothetical protein
MALWGTMLQQDGVRGNEILAIYNDNFEPCIIYEPCSAVEKVCFHKLNKSRGDVAETHKQNRIGNSRHWLCHANNKSCKKSIPIELNNK